MRGAALIVVTGTLAACAAPAPVRQDPTAEVRQECAGRMYAARARGAVHWHIYEYCLKEHP